MDIVNVVQSIKKYYKLNLEHNSYNELDLLLENNKPKHIIFVCLDGLGYNLLENTDFLKGNLFNKINTVFPPTTACATISLQTGLYPKEHGWIGWAQYFEIYDDVIELFTQKGHYNNIKYDLSIIDELKYKKYYENINNSKEFFPDFVEDGSKTFNEMLTKVEKHIESKENTFSYCYWTEPDHVLHHYGTKSESTIITIKELEKQLYEFSNKIKDATIIVTADHGHIDTKCISLQKYPELLDCLKSLPSIEPRCVNLFIEKDMHKQFINEVKPLLKYFDLYNKEEVKKEYFNKGNFTNPIINKFLGDYTLIAKDEYILSYDEVELIGMHGGKTLDEMEVPLIIINK